MRGKLQAQWRPAELTSRFRGCHLSVFRHHGKWWWDVSNGSIHHGEPRSTAWVAMKAAERFVSLSVAVHMDTTRRSKKTPRAP
jgi:hypothetical protein